MSLLAGSFSLSRYRLDQEPPAGFFGRVRDLVVRFAFVDIEDSDAEASVGWVDAADTYDPGFGRLGVNVGPFIVLGLRQDARTVSPALLKKYTELETRRLQAERPERPLTTHHRREVRDRTLTRLRGRLPAATKVVHVVWDTDTGDIFLGAATPKWRQVFEDLFINTFDLIPILQAPPLAAARLDPAWDPDALDRLAPANLARVVGEKVMDVVTAIKRLEFLGQEFLIWLWFTAETQDGVIRLPDGAAVGIEPINVMTLASGQGATGFTVACRGRQVDSPETRVALQQGRRLTRAGFAIRTDQAAWHLSVDAATGALTGARPAPDPERDDDADEDLLARLLKLRDLAAVLDSLLKMFLAVRLDERWEGEDLPALRRWIASS